MKPSLAMSINQMPTLVLASTSPFRRELLSRLEFPFICRAPDIDETRLKGESAHDMVERLAIEKAKAVSHEFEHALIIGSDQCAINGEAILGKPHTHENAVKQLQAASGKTVEFLTSLCLYNTQTQTYQVAVIPFAVKFRPLSDTTIKNYLRREQPYSCAGSFKSEGLGITLFESMQGTDPNALIGLPMIQLTSFLQNEGIHLPLAPTKDSSC